MDKFCDKCKRETPHKKGKTEHRGIPMNMPTFVDVVAGTRSPPLGDWVEWICTICNSSLWQVNVG